MAGVDNLTHFNEMPEEKQKKIASAGGKASGEARRRKKAMREQMELLLALPLQSKKAKKTLETLGVDEDNMDNQMALIVAMFKEAMEGDTTAFQIIRDTIGEKPIDRRDVNVSESQKFSDVVKQLGGKGLSDDD